MKFKHILIVLLSIIIVGCSTTKEAVIIHDTIAIAKYNNVYIHDSIFKDRVHYEYIKGDTVFKIDTIWDKRYLTEHDTITKDSVVYKTHDVIKTETVTKNHYPIWPYIVFLSVFFIAIGLYKYKNKK